MRRLMTVLVLIVLGFPALPVSGQAQASADRTAAATVAVELSALEASNDFNALYDRIHPDAHAVIPRAAAIGWFQNEFAPRGPGVSTVTGVRFIEWTWAVTGQTYPYTAEVSFEQPFADGSIVQDVVRLVQDGKGEWRWFFGRSREFVDEQIALYAPRVPVQTATMSIVDVAITALDDFWAVSFGAAGQRYSNPEVVAATSYVTSPCGAFDASTGPAAYCPSNATVYYSPDWFAYFDASIGDFAWVTVIAHEWGHHVQALEGIVPGSDNSHELQADCLAGSYARDAETRGLLDPGDVTEALTISSISGDPVGLPQDERGAHGTSDDRVTSFMRGFLDGFLGCDFLSSSGDTRVIDSAPVPSGQDLTAFLPQPDEVPSGLVRTGDQNRSLAEVVVNYSDPAETERLFADWGWEGNVTRSYEGTGTNGQAASIYASVHRFDSAHDAVNALDYSFQNQAESTGASEVAVSPLATTTRALATGSDVTIYAQQGDVVIRLTVAGPEITALSAAANVLRAILARTG